MYKTLLILSILILTGCGKAPVDDADVQAIVDEFQTIYNIQILEVSISFVDSYPDAKASVGRCYSDPFSGNRITLKKSSWDAFDYTNRKMLLFHELGHCVFNRKHREDVYEDNCPKSLMIPSLSKQKCFRDHEADLIAELNTAS